MRTRITCETNPQTTYEYSIRARASHFGFKFEKLTVADDVLSATVESPRLAWAKPNKALTVHLMVSTLRHRNFLLRHSISSGVSSIGAPSSDDGDCLLMMDACRTHVMFTTGACSAVFDFETEACV